MDDTDKKSRRQAQLVAHLQHHRFISLDEISTRFGVTTQTARRDLIDLEEAGLVRRLHGGGTLAAPPIDPPTYRRRRVENADGKVRIGERVAQLVGDGSAVFLDTGTTCEAVARALTRRERLRVVTYSLRSATLLSEVETATVAVPGGFVRHVDAGVFNHDTVDFIGAFRFDTAVISVSGIDEHGVMGDDDHGEVQAVRAAMRQADRTILAVDGSKFFRRGLVSLAAITEVDLVVTDSAPPPAIAALLADAGVRMELIGG
ncbi:DeoR/GlpR family transcriptional regulator [Tistrella bauzanensis]|uniref:DeoR/GlpR family transcriptional regulator n=1 Tax=Tistrella bauzanensis TaxID=657419 RepID=A0ABQ1IVD8_9PROT|nr:DeoR/GlpR family DNA-binding transcription regulator [Tistrella bauzanensis]GGB53407.1 DeoR/GlpR family transcriptional regulator [Tistrella bauzanensis]